MISDRLKPLIVATIVLLTLGTSVRGEDSMVLGPRQFEQDKTGAGTVLCAWAIYVDVQGETAACGLPRRPGDDAIDEAIVAIDDFILTNSSLHPTRSMLEEFKRRAVADAVSFGRAQGFEKHCAREDLEFFRSGKPEEIRASVKKLLALPREPVINPCL